MDILLINKNPVVSRLIQLCATQVGISVVCMKSLQIDDIKENTIVIIDDGLFTTDIKDILESTHIGYRVLLVSKGFTQDRLVIFDDIVHKPFVPSRILDILTFAIEELKKNTSYKIISELSSVDSEDKNTTQILDQNELNKIKTILEQSEERNFSEIDDIEERKLQAFTEHLLSDGVEITSEDEYIQSITKKPKKYKKALKDLIDNALDDIIQKVGKESFKQAIKEDRVSLKFKIKEID